MRYVFNTHKGKRYSFPTHSNVLVMDRAEASVSEVILVILEPGQAPPMHSHFDTEQIFYVLEGKGLLSIGGEDEKIRIEPGDVVRIPPGTVHSIRAEAGSLRYLGIDCFTEDRAEDEPTWEDHVRVLCRQQGWNYDEVQNKPGNN